MKSPLTKLHSYYHDFFRSSNVRKNITKVYGGDVLSKIISVGTAIIVIRGLSVSDYAAYTAFYTILLLIPGLVGNGVNLALVRFSAEYISKEERQPVELYFASFVFQFLLYSILGGVIFLVSDGVNKVLFGPKVFDSALIYGLLGGMGFLISQAGRGVYNAEEKFGNYIKILWLRQAMTFGVVLLLILLKLLNYINVARSIIAIELGIAGIISYHIFKDIDFNKISLFLRERSGIIREFVLSARWLIAYFIILSCLQRLNIFMLSHLSSENELANYSVAFRYYALALLLLNSIHAVLLPRFAKIDMQDSSRQSQFIVKWLKATTWLIIPIILIDSFGKPLFLWINGVQYEKAYLIFVIFSIGVWVSLMFSPLVNILMARKAFKFLFILSCIAFAINFIGNYFIIPLWGGIGTAVVAILSIGLINIVSGMRIFFYTQ